MCFSRLLSCCRCPINSPMLVSDVRSNLKSYRCLDASLVRDWPICHVYPTKKLGFISLSCTCVFLSWLVIVWLKLLLAVLYCTGKNKVQNVTVIFVLCPIASFLFLFFWVVFSCFLAYFSLSVGQRLMGKLNYCLCSLAERYGTYNDFLLNESMGTYC